MILREKREVRDQSPFFFENIKFWKSLPRAPNFKYPPLGKDQKKVFDLIHDTRIGCRIAINRYNIQCLARRSSLSAELEFPQNINEFF